MIRNDDDSIAGPLTDLILESRHLMPGFFAYLLFAAVFTIGGFLHLFILTFRKRQLATPYAGPEVISWCCTYVVNQSLFTILSLNSELSLVLPVYLAMPFATLGWWWLIIRQFRTARSFERYVWCALPVLYVPVLFLIPMLGLALGNWPYGTFRRGLDDDLLYTWMVVCPVLHVLSLLLVITTWSPSVESNTESTDPGELSSLKHM